MKLELRHIAPYLPYRLEMISTALGRPAYNMEESRRLKKVEILTGGNLDLLLFLKRKPILRPLYDLTKEIEHNGERFVPIERLQELHPASMKGIRMICFEERSAQWMLNTNRDGEVSINIMRLIDQKLFEWHFDIFNLIPSGLAIDKSQLEKNQP